MIRINFNLRKQSTKKAVPVYLICRWDGNRLVYSTKINVIPANFDTDRQRVRRTNKEPLHALLNKSLDKLQEQTEKVYFEFLAKGTTPTPPEFREALDYETGRKRKAIVDFWEYFTQFIERSGNRVNPNTGKKIAYRTIQKYKSTYNILREYEKESNNTLTFSGLTLEVLTDFLQWLNTGKEYKKNTVAKHWETFKAVLNSAINEKQPVNLDYKNPSLRAGREQPDTIYLTETELLKLDRLNLSENTRLERVRDLFLIASYTGLRFSDFTNIEPHNIGNDYLRLTQRKTGNKVSIPIHPTVKRLFHKYKDKAIKPISNQKFNDYIKEVCKLAGLTQIVETQSTKAGKIVREKQAKYKLVSSHTGRRTLATNLYKKGIPIQTIMTITGHKTEQSFRAYIRLSDIEHAELIKDFWNEKG